MRVRRFAGTLNNKGFQIKFGVVNWIESWIESAPGKLMCVLFKNR